MTDEVNAMRAFVGLPPIEPRPLRPHFEEIMLSLRPTNARALLVLMLREVARERRRLFKHGWRFSPTYKAQLRKRPIEILAEVRQMRAVLAKEVKLP